MWRSRTGGGFAGRVWGEGRGFAHIAASVFLLRWCRMARRVQQQQRDTEAAPVRCFLRRCIAVCWIRALSVGVVLFGAALSLLRLCVGRDMRTDYDTAVTLCCLCGVARPTGCATFVPLC